MIEAAIFDLDGTLVDSMWMWETIDREFLGARGIEVPEDLQECIEGKSYTETAEYFVRRFQLKESAETLKEIWNKMALEAYENRVSVKPGAMDFLKTLKKEGIPCGIATSNSRILAEAVLKAQGIAPYFQSVRTACEVAAGKPAPDIYLKVAEDLGASPERCVAFEDVPAGTRAARAAGMKVYAVEDAFSAQAAEEKARLADGCIRNYQDLLRKEGAAWALRW